MKNVDVKPVNTCCENCKEVCFNMDMQVVQDALYAGKIKLSETSIKKNLYYENGYVKGLLCKDKEEKLSRNIKLLQKYMDLYKDPEVMKCLCEEDIQKIVDNILGIADISCCKSTERCDVIIDDSGYSQWVLENPRCQVYEQWEAAYYGTCDHYELGEVFLREDPKLIYEINVAEVIDKCALVTAISVQNSPECKFDLSITGKLKECEKLHVDVKAEKVECDNLNIDIKAEKVECDNLNVEIRSELIKCGLSAEISTQLMECGWEISKSVRLIECGIKPEVVVELSKCGLKVEPNVELNSCDIYLKPDVKITMCDLKFSINNEKIDCKLVSSILGVNLC